MPTKLRRGLRIHQHSHPPQRARAVRASKDVVEAFFDQRGWAKGKALSAPGLKGRVLHRDQQQSVILLEDTATGELRVFRETRHDVFLVVSGKLPLA